MKKIILILSSVFIAGLFNAQILNLDWAKDIAGTNSNKANSVTSDAAGNVYTTGYFTEVADFDPDFGTYTLSSIGVSDIFVLKQNASGNLLWAKNIGGGNSTNFATSINVDNANNIYVTGAFQGTVDFDSGPSTYTLTSFGAFDIFVLKLDAMGNFLWARQMGGSSTDYGYSVISNSSGVYVSGFFNGASEFNQSPSTYTLSSAGGSDAFVAKLDATGNLLWAKQMGGTANEIAYSMKIDVFGDVVTCGNFNGVADFDPGAAVVNLTSNGVSDIFISKLDASGNFVWAKNMGGSSADIGMSITTNTTGEIYTTGYFQSVADFDPGVSTFTLNSGGNTDIFISKLDTGGNFVWAKAIGGPANDLCRAIALDLSGDIYMTGEFTGTIDFDPNVAVNNLTSTGIRDIYILKLSNIGSFIWAQSFGDTTSVDYGYSISVDAAGIIYTTGTFNNTVDFDPSAGIDTLSSSLGPGVETTYILKLNEITLGIKENTIASTLNIYPNPTDGILHLHSDDFSKNSEIRINDILGQQVTLSKNENVININNLKEGIYFLQFFEDGKLIATQKVIKE